MYVCVCMCVCARDRSEQTSMCVCVCMCVCGGGGEERGGLFVVSVFVCPSVSLCVLRENQRNTQVMYRF